MDGCVYNAQGELVCTKKIIETFEEIPNRGKKVDPKSAIIMDAINKNYCNIMVDKNGQMRLTKECKN